MPFVAQTTAHDLLASGELVIVPGDQAARQLRHLHDEKQLALGKRAWMPAAVLTWDQWVRSLWSDLVTGGFEDRLLLNATQEHSLWLQTIQTPDQTSTGLTSPDALAELAATAWQLSEAYGATDRLRASATTHDARIFAAWADSFARTCRSAGVVSRASLEAALLSSVRRGELSCASQLAFAGFERWTPAQSDLLYELRAAGVPCRATQIVAATDSGANGLLHEAETEEAELYAVASWIRHFITDRMATGLPARVGVLVPDLDSAHDDISNIFRKVLAPELQDVSAPPDGAPFEFSRGGLLSAEPLVAAALNLVRWASAPLSRDTVSALLLSPYLTQPDAMEHAARFDASILRTAALLRPEVSLYWLEKELWQNNAAAHIPWPHQLSKFLDGAERLDAPQTFAQWTEFMRRLLRATGWPGEATSDAELALQRAWEHALDSVATLDFNGLRAPFAEALHALERELSNTPASTSSGRALVQVLEPSAALGTTFDALILTRATDTNWPDLPRTNPLIAWPLQASLGMPGANHNGAIEDARLQTANLLTSAPTALFSFAATASEGSQRLSPLIAELHLTSVQPAALADDKPDDLFIEAELTNDTIPLPPLASSLVSGGATVLQHQAACGFRAFAEVRLRAQELETRDLGYDARDRGNLLHSVMQAFWETVKTQQALRAMPTSDRDALLQQLIREKFATRIEEDATWDVAYLHLQKQRMFTLLRKWLAQELTRSPFTVSATERSETLTVGPLELKVRVDRIDSTGDGEILIDYKTGSAGAVADWDGERPDAPQLPLYSMLEREEPFAGLAFAKVRPGAKMGWYGFAAQPNVLPGRNTTREMDTLREGWHGTLSALATSFADGDITVDPKTYPTTCSMCAQNLLCRLDAATLLDTEEPDESSDEEVSFD